MDPSVRWTGQEMLVLPLNNSGGAFLDPCALAWRRTADAMEGRGLPWADSDSGLLYFSYSWYDHAVFSLFDPRRNLWRTLSVQGLTDVFWPLRPTAVGDQGLLLWSTRRDISHAWTLDDLKTPPGFWYDLAGDRWRAARSGPTLAGREAPAIAWTGKQLFVWGGQLPLQIDRALLASGALDGIGGLVCPSRSWPDQCRYGDGALYDPVRDVWTPINRTGAPSPRGGATAVWTGKRVVVWGGDGYSGPDRFVMFADGSLYDPQADAWSAITPPPPRDRIPVVGRISEGELSRRFLLGDLLYDPEQDGWSAVPPYPGPGDASCTGGPQAGALVHLCTTAAYKYEFRIYSFATGTWTLIPPWPSQPAQLGTVLWTGSQLVIWGGWRYGATPANPCTNVPANQPCDPPGPERVPINEGAVFTP
jgi:hypothetical protein